MSRAFEIRVIDLEGLSVSNFIEFLRIEILDVRGYGPTFFGQGFGTLSMVLNKRKVCLWI